MVNEAIVEIIATDAIDKLLNLNMGIGMIAIETEEEMMYKDILRKRMIMKEMKDTKEVVTMIEENIKVEEVTKMEKK